MISNMYSIRDEAAQAFGQPFFCQTEPQALRSFRMLCLDPSSTVYHCPGDFALYLIGTFDDQDGNLLVPELGSPTLVIRGDSFSKEETHV